MFAGRKVVGCVLAMAAVAGFVPDALGGPWSQLPDAVARLQASPGDETAAATLRAAEESILGEATAGRVAAVAALMEAYVGIVSPLVDGDIRVELMERRAAVALVGWGDRTAARDGAAALRAWTLAARLDPSGDALQRLAERLLPPPDAQPGTTWRSPADGAELVLQPAVSTRIGCSSNDRDCRDDERFFRWVEVAPLWVDRTEVTNDHYRRCVDAGYCDPPVDRDGFDDPRRDDFPVTGVTWGQAARYARWSGRRLPSEAEWERTARGRDLTPRYPWGRDRGEVPANVLPAELAPPTGPQAVASYPPTGWGVFDIGGNVYEWCDDRYQTGLKQVPDDGGAVGLGWGRVVRGGSFRRTVELARVSARWWHDQDYRADDLGLRLVLDPQPEPRVLVELADNLFPSNGSSPDALADADLAGSDRRYLERRALTWLVLEERIEEALRQAGNLLERGSRDPVVLAFLDRFERDLLGELAIGDLDQGLRWLSDFMLVAASERHIQRRLAAQHDDLVAALRARGDEASRAGRERLARDAYVAALQLEPDDPLLPRLIAAARPAPGQVRVAAGDGREMSWIPGGSFRMGATAGDSQIADDEVPTRVVEVRGFWLDRREVTNADYRACVEAGACTPPSRPVMFDDPNLVDFPVLWVDWHQARDYAAWAGKRLPTEAEWEYAARAGHATRYPWGTLWREGAANAAGTDGDDRFGGSAPVGSFPPNAWGLYDILGNAAEWVADLYHRDYRHAPADSRAWDRVTGGPIDDRRVIRGGSYDDPPARLRVSHRTSRPPLEGHRTTGFRCAQDE